MLPAACFAETDGTFTNTERRVQRVRKAVDAARARPRRLGDRRANSPARMGYPMDYAGAEAIMDEIAAVTPSYCGITYARLEKRGHPLALPGTGPPGHALPAHGQFTCGLGRFSAVEYRPPAEKADAEYPLMLTTGRVLYHYHTGTMTMLPGAQRLGAGVLRGDRAPRTRAPRASRTARGARRLAPRRDHGPGRRLGDDRARHGLPAVPLRRAAGEPADLGRPLDPVAKIPEFKVCAVRVGKVATELETMTAAGEERA